MSDKPLKPLHLSQLLIYFNRQIRNHFKEERTSFISTFTKIFINKISNHSQTLIPPITNKKTISFYCDELFFKHIKCSNYSSTNILHDFLPTLLHLRYTCPYPSIVHHSHQILHHILQTFNLQSSPTILSSNSNPYPISAFLDMENTLISNKITLNSKNLSLNQYLFTLFGRLSHFDLLLSVYDHTSYLKSIRELFQSLMYDSKCGPLMLDKRQFIGIMACSRYSCVSLITQLELRFLRMNGERKWIESGMSMVPYKYQKMNELNAVLAHQPWLLTSAHISDLVHGHNCWTISEVVQAITIMVCYHFLCSIYDGMCITHEYDHYFERRMGECDGYDLRNDLEYVLKTVGMDETPLSDSDDSDGGSDGSSDDDEIALGNITDILSASNTEQEEIIKSCVSIVGEYKEGFEAAANINLSLETVNAPNSDDEQSPSVNENTLNIMSFDEQLIPPFIKENNKNKNENISDLNHKYLTSKNWLKIISLRRSNKLMIKSEPKLERVEIITVDERVEIANKQIVSKTPSTPNKIKYKTIKKTIKRKISHKIKNIPEKQGMQYSKYNNGISMVYKNFNMHQCQPLHFYEFNWNNHGYECLSTYFSPMFAKKMDECFMIASQMTDHCINHMKDINTQPFRSAVWHYAFRLYGINNDSYDYRCTNIFLTIKLKIFIKKLICYSQIMNIGDVRRIGISLKEKEKLHVAIIALAAKKQACLLYAMRAVTTYMAHS